MCVKNELHRCTRWWYIRKQCFEWSCWNYFISCMSIFDGEKNDWPPWMFSRNTCFSWSFLFGRHAFDRIWEARSWKMVRMVSKTSGSFSWCLTNDWLKSFTSICWQNCYIWLICRRFQFHLRVISDQYSSDWIWFLFCRWKTRWYSSASNYFTTE